MNRSRSIAAGLPVNTPAGDRGEVLGRPAVTLANGNELAVERGTARNVGEGRQQRAQAGGEIGAVARAPAHLSPAPTWIRSRNPSHLAEGPTVHRRASGGHTR